MPVQALPLFESAMLADPYPVYRQLRESDPVHWHKPFGAWIVTRYYDVLTVLHDFELFREAFMGFIARRRAQPGSDLLSASLQVEDSGDRLTDEEVFANANLLLTAGHETTTTLIGNGALALLRNPEQLARIKAGAEAWPMAIEELLRYDGPVQFIHRLALADRTVGGKAIRKGQFVYLVLAAANRDPAVFADPDRLDVIRTNSHHHLAFAQGIHYCLGAPLARLEARIALGTLIRRFPKLRLEDNHLEYRDSFNQRCLKALPVCLD